MGWKDWPSWLKGGLWVMGIVLIFRSVGWFLESILNRNIDWMGEILIITAYPFILFSFLFSDELGILFWFLSFIYYFLLGAIIGWLVGKFKK